MRVTIEEILHFLVADTVTPSTMGAQLERLRFGLTTTPDPFRSREDAEAHILEQAEILRTVDAFKAVQEFKPSTPKAAGYRTLDKIQRGTLPRLCQGTIALNALKVYQQWSPTPQNEARALVAVYGYVRSIAPRLTPPLSDHNVELATQAFREGKAKRAKALAADTLADSLLALGSFLQKRNKK